MSNINYVVSILILILKATCNGKAPLHIRLVGGNTTLSSVTGRLEVLHNDTWGTVCDDLFGDNEARVVCRMLGYRSGSQKCCGAYKYGGGTGPIWLDDVECSGTESDILKCQHKPLNVTNCDHSEDVGVTCTAPLHIRLVGGNKTSYSISGRLEVLHNDNWSTVCDDLFGWINARVVCRMLGYRSGYSRCCGAYGEGAGPIWLDDVKCSGIDSDIFECQHKSLNVTNCDHSKDVGVICTAPLHIRLVGGPTTSSSISGRLEVLHNDTWGTVCDDSFGVNDARVVCRMLGYRSSYLKCCGSYTYGGGTGPIWLDDVECSGTESDILQCKHRNLSVNNCGHSEDVGVTCRPKDVDECLNPNICGANAVCVNVQYSYHCICNGGFWLNGNVCFDVDECVDRDTHTCDPNAVCMNVPGSYSCACLTGFFGDGKNCTDKNECSIYDPCDLNAVCLNFPGGYDCTCNTGFSGDGKNCSNTPIPNLGEHRCVDNCTEDSGLDKMTGRVIGISIGSVMASTILAIICVILCRRRKKQAAQKEREETAKNDHIYVNTPTNNNDRNRGPHVYEEVRVGNNN